MRIFIHLLKIYSLMKKITLNNIQHKVLENEIRDFELSGCQLENNKNKD